MIDERTLGQLEARVNALESEMREIRDDVKQVLAILNQTRGSWKTLVIIGGISGSIGAVLAKLIPGAQTLIR